MSSIVKLESRVYVIYFGEGDGNILWCSELDRKEGKMMEQRFVRLEDFKRYDLGMVMRI
jgi:hypothetical protein